MWQPLGEVVPEFDRWLVFPNNPGNASLFRVRFIADGNAENIFSRCWFRRMWTPGLFREKEVEPSQRLYPQPHSLILWLPIPEPFLLAGIAPYGYEIKKEYWSRRGIYAEPNFSVSVDFWTEVEQQQIEEQLDINTERIDELTQEIQGLNNLINSLELP